MTEAILQHTCNMLQHGTEASSQFSPTLCGPCWVVYAEPPALNRGAALGAAALIFVAHHFQRGPKVPLVGFNPGGSNTPPHHCTLLGALGCRWRKSGGSSPRMLICRGPGWDEGWVGRAGKVGGKNSTDAHVPAT